MPSVVIQKLSFSLQLNPKNFYNSLQIFLPESGYFRWKCCCYHLTGTIPEQRTIH